jgi:hypothetical protein
VAMIAHRRSRKEGWQGGRLDGKGQRRAISQMRWRRSG